jgi:hypothetical protein
MTSKLNVAFAIALCIGFVAACGGGQGQTLKDRELESVDTEGSVVDSIVGSVTPVTVAEDKPEQPTEGPVTPIAADQDAIDGPQGAFVAKIIVQNKEVAGTFKVLTATASPEIVRENVAAGTEIRLDPGLYDFIFITEAVAGGGESTLRGVEIEAGRRTKREVKYKVGQITLVTGASCQKKPIQIRKKGATDWLPGKFSTCVPIILESGDYDAQMGGKGGIPISGIQVYDGGIREILIRKQ